MSHNLIVLMAEAVGVYLLVLGVHALRHRAGLTPFYILLGGITAVMSWVTDAGVQVEAGGITFMVGSTVFYTSLLLGVFVVYVFDGPRAARAAILSVAGVSALVPLIAALLHLQTEMLNTVPLHHVPVPGLRINAASVIATVLDFTFLAVAWEVLGSSQVKINMWFRALLTLLGVMWLDVILFSTGAFFGTPGYLGIMEGTLYSRLIIALFASPFLYTYLIWQTGRPGQALEQRPALSILKEVAEVREELGQARREIEVRKESEEALQRSELRYRRLALRMDRLLESERGALADELHDQIGQMMTALKIDLSQCEKVVAEIPEVREHAAEMHKLLSDGIQRIHALCRQLRPGSLDDIGLGDALQELADDWSKTSGVVCELEVRGRVELSAEKRIALFRLVQEALANVAHHAHASRVLISLHRGISGTEFSIEDNGCGMPPEAEKNPFSFGLLGMRERVEAVRGTLNIQSIPGRGTKIEGVIPS
jgi:signal transduction histidine kinase